MSTTRLFLSFCSATGDIALVRRRPRALACAAVTLTVDKTTVTYVATLAGPDAPLLLIEHPDRDVLDLLVEARARDIRPGTYRKLKWTAAPVPSDDRSPFGGAS